MRGIICFVYVFFYSLNLFSGKESDGQPGAIPPETLDLGGVSEDFYSNIFKIIPNINFSVFSFVNKMRDGGFRDPG